jgi:hypothetical protein
VVSGADPQPPSAAPTGERGRRSGKRRVTVGFAVMLVVLALLGGVVLGYVARGGPHGRVLVTTDQDLQVVTVTSEVPAPAPSTTP